MSTVNLPIGGGHEFPRDQDPAQHDRGTRRDGASRTGADELLSRYGMRAAEYCRSLAGTGETSLASLPNYTQEELSLSRLS